jgi:predicted  nucleic acid-binding Zn-ribbon protein
MSDRPETVDETITRLNQEILNRTDREITLFGVIDKLQSELAAAEKRVKVLDYALEQEVKDFVKAGEEFVKLRAGIERAIGGVENLIAAYDKVVPSGDPSGSATDYDMAEAQSRKEGAKEALKIIRTEMGGKE